MQNDAVQLYEILLIDDHAMFRTGLRMVLEAEMEGVRIAEAASLSEALLRIWCFSLL